jgi:hypothetical protein
MWPDGACQHKRYAHVAASRREFPTLERRAEAPRLYFGWTLAARAPVSVLKFRAPGMSLDRMPIFAWYALATALMMIMGFPPLILGSILFELERAFGLPFFEPGLGGDPLLWRHLFWLFGHPEFEGFDSVIEQANPHLEQAAE